MPTLAPKLPYTHPFAGGFPYRGSQRLPSDPDALTYLAAVAAADGAPVEVGVAMAVENFIKGCRADGTFSALKAACILCGARTLAGALVPLVGTAPTNNNFVDADYNREAGLIGNGTTKYLDSGRASDADGTNDVHLATYVTGAASGGTYTAGANGGGANHTLVGVGYWCRSLSGQPGNAPGVGLHAISRSTSASFLYVDKSASPQTSFKPSANPTVSNNSYVFAYNNSGSAAGITNATLAFYSIGESISDLALLDARVTALVQRIQLSLSTGLDVSGYDDATVAYLLAAYNNGATLE